MTHGTISGYSKGRCRCGECRAAKAAWQRAYRRRRGFDEIAVERACLGDRMDLSRPERHAVIARLNRRGLPAWRIAELAGVTTRTVQRHRTGRLS